MIARRILKTLSFPITVVILGASLLGLFAGTALATPPNDNFAAPTVITALPFSDSVDNTTATTEPGEPQPCASSPQTVWYSFTPTADALVRADMAGSSFFDTALNAYQAVGPGFGGLNFLGCSTFSANPITFRVHAGATYYLQTGSVFTGGGDLHVNLQVIPPPTNDDFSKATPFNELPFSDTVDTADASLQVGEPTPSCAPSTLGGTVWYAFTPTASGSVSANINNAAFSTLIAAYSGDSLNRLTEVGCRSFGGVLTFHANAGTTYFYQVSGLFGAGGSLQFHLDVAPAPVVNLFFFPFDPSVFDTVQFSDSSFDPGQAGFQSRLWNFGDGATATVQSPTHRYAADADYTVQLTVTTVDGRTASASQPVHVQTHDVAITKFTAPQAAKAGQTRQITVDVNSQRYPETVRVQLLKSGGGFQEIGNLTQSVPVRGANRTTPFSFNYTFTADDAAIGKVTFKAVANLVNARDALTADNEAIASPTKVTQ